MSEAWNMISEQQQKIRPLQLLLLCEPVDINQKLLGET